MATANGSTYELAIYLPPEYAKTDREYPLVVVLDGSFQAAPVASMAEKTDLHPIVIGINNQNHSAQARWHDYSPYINKQGKKMLGGGAQEFLQFLKSEFLPAMHHQYRVASNKMSLMGHSLGGLFATYAGIHIAKTSQFDSNRSEPKSVKKSRSYAEALDIRAPPLWFSTFVAASPSIWIDGGALLEDDELWSNFTFSQPRSIFSGAGELEDAAMIGYLHAFTNKIAGISSPSIRFEKRIFKHHSHETSWLAVYRHALTIENSLNDEVE